MRFDYFRLPFPNKFRTMISEKMLRLAAKLPKSNNGYLQSLQKIYAESAKEAQDVFDRSRPSDGVNLEFLGLRMFEVFYYEDFDTLKAGLERLFPRLNEDFSNETFDEDFYKFSNSVTTGGSRHVGWIYRDRKPMGPINPIRMPNLPVEIDHINVEIRKELPSMFIVVFDVKFNSKASLILTSMQESKLFPEVRLGNIYLKDKYFGFSRFAVERSMEKKMHFEILRLAGGVEHELSKYIKGVFWKDKRTGLSLPVIEIYSIKGMVQKKFSYWADRLENWWRSLGFYFFMQTFYNKKFAFHWAHKTLFLDLPIPNRVIVFEEPFLREMGKNRDLSDSGWVIFHTMCGILDDISVPIILIEILKNKLNQIETFRSKVYKIMSKNGFTRRSLLSQLKIYNSLLQETRGIERLLLEFDRQYKFFMSLESSEVRNLKELVWKLKPGKKEAEFIEDLTLRIAYIRKNFEDHLGFLKTSFSDHLEYINLDAVYRLQVLSILLAVVAFIASLFGVLGNWQEIIYFYNIIFNF